LYCIGRVLRRLSRVVFTHYEFDLWLLEQQVMRVFRFLGRDLEASRSWLVAAPWGRCAFGP